MAFHKASRNASRNASCLDAKIEQLAHNRISTSLLSRLAVQRPTGGSSERGETSEKQASLLVAIQYGSVQTSVPVYDPLSGQTLTDLDIICDCYDSRVGHNRRMIFEVKTTISTSHDKLASQMESRLGWFPDDIIVGFEPSGTSADLRAQMRTEQNFKSFVQANSGVYPLLAAELAKRDNNQTKRAFVVFGANGLASLTQLGGRGIGLQHV
jgi:hypothetical protein